MNEIWYFAYGANMADEVISRRRKVRYSEKSTARLTNYRLVFSSKGVRFIEPGFANVEPSPGDEVFGIAYRLSRAGLDKIIMTESTDYSLVDVQVSLDNEDTICAKTLINHVGMSGLKPSKRYIDLLVRGAKSNGLPSHYAEFIESHPYHHIPIISDAFNLALALFIKPLFMIMAKGQEDLRKWKKKGNRRE